MGKIAGKFMNHDKKFYAYLSLAVAETIALIWFSSIPSAEFVPTGVLLRPGDLEHFIAYSVYGFLWSRVFVNFNEIRGKRENRILFGLILPLLIGSVAGAACETIQLFVPTRVADMLDWAIDAFGSFFGAAIASKFKNLF
jgi:hypothetical protein